MGDTVIFQGRRTAAFYEPMQDRIRIDIEDANGAAMSIHLTRRITASLAQSMAEKIKSKGSVIGQTLVFREEAKKSPVGGAAISDETPSKSAPALAPKPIQASHPPLLITGIDYRALPKVYRLIFKDATQAVLLLAFTPAQLHQWLAILQALAKKAVWQIEHWPKLGVTTSLRQGTNVTLH